MGRHSSFGDWGFAVDGSWHERQLTALSATHATLASINTAKVVPHRRVPFGKLVAMAAPKKTPIGRRSASLAQGVWAAGVWAAGVWAALLATQAVAAPATVNFDRDIRPILSKNCFECHGPDFSSRETKWRLDIEQDVYQRRDGVALVVPGDTLQSELLRRISTSDADKRMPPVDSGKSLTPAQIDTIAAWIRQGAKWEGHWSFTRPRRAAIHNVDQRDWARDPLDQFVLQKLEAEGLQPSSEASRETLIRRVTWDLTGIPPSPREVDEFLSDMRPDAYGRLVDRLLASQRFGERMALDWMDAARYADTHGFHEDKPRDMWPWRDWVIDAFNQNMAFDTFTVEQLAGDLIPNATQDQMTATGFNRNHGVTGSGIAEEYRVEYVIDRVKTTSTVWMGLTLGCAQCHDHKYDPISQADFYRFFAFFNNIPDRGVEDKSGNVVPLLELRSAEQLEQRRIYREQLAETERQLAARESQVDSEFALWEQAESKKGPSARPAPSGLVAYFPLDERDGLAVSSVAPADESQRDADGNAGQGTNGTIVGNPQRAMGRDGGALVFDGATHVELNAKLQWKRTDAFSYGAWIFPTGGGAVISKMDDGQAYRGFDVFAKGKQIEVHMIHHWPDNALHLVTNEILENEKWQHVFVTYDGSSRAAGIRVYVDGTPRMATVTIDALSDSIQTTSPLRIGRRNPGGAFQGRIDDVRFYDRRLSDTEVATLPGENPIALILAIDAAKRTSQQKQTLQRHYLEHVDKPYRALSKRIATLRANDVALDKDLPNVMVMQEMAQRRDTFILNRGRYDLPDKKVDPGIPSCLPPLPPGPSDRLAMARWLVAPEHPLTARVYVNRLWQMAFGTGLVKTSEDFGSQGERPSHQELLDWLAIDFVESGWDVKTLVRRIVTSATYRQSSEISAELLDRDPENRLLARGPRYRLPAESIRDGALSAAGLLVERVGGPSVKPYQPAGLWLEVAIQTYEQDQGEGLFRRSLYTYRKRQVPPPNLATFDAPNREFCVVRRSRTNTPLQALVMLNDPTFVEAARALAQRAMVKVPNETGDDEGEVDEVEVDKKRADYLFQLATSRMPSPRERRVLLRVYRDQLAIYRKNTDAAKKRLSIGVSPRHTSLDDATLAAWANVAGLILNLDESMTKE